ncbi:sodium/solute symporter [candidate division KSB1 bacterium]|nr:sodium/solute symporter [candidate division KSB1 bacterium]
MTMNIGGLDLAIIALYFAVVFGIGFYFSRRGRTSADYFLAGRNVGWVAVGASLFATNISSEHFVGLAGSGAATGLAVGHFEWLACIIVLILGWVFAPFYLRSKVFTMPEFLERRYNSASRWYLTSVSVLAYVLTKVSVTLLAGSLLLNQLTGWDVYTSSIVLVVLTGVYTIAGGLKAVIYTELMQTFVLIGGAAVLTVMGLVEIGGWSQLRQAVPADFFSMFRPMSDPDFPWTGILFGAPILGIWYWCTDQYIVQRVLSAKNIDTAQSATVFAGFLKILPVFILVLPGIIARALYPDISGDQAYPALVARLLPVGMQGLVVAGLLAALMSSLAACFNSSSTLLTIDVYQKLRPHASDRELVHFGRVATGVLVLLGILWVPFIKMLSAQLYIYMQSVQAYISPPIAAVFLLGVFWPRANGAGAIAALLTGLVLGAVRFVAEIVNKQSGIGFEPLRWLAEINFLHFAILLFVICTTMLAVVSLITRPPAMESVRGLTFRHTARHELRSGAVDGTRRRWNLIASTILVLVVVALWTIFF